MRYKVRMLIETLIGVPVAYSIESRIFNGVALFITVILGLNALVNFLIGLPILAILMFVTSLAALFMYYLSKIKKKLNIAVILFGLIGNAVVALNYFYNSGIDGPSIYISILLLFLIVAISPEKQYVFWLLINLSVVSVLVMTSYFYPHLITNSYGNELDHFIDIAYSYVAISLVIGLVTIYIKNTYNKQKTLLEDKAKQLKAANQTKDKLFSIIAHDLRSPLASIQSYLEILNEFKFSEEEKNRMEQELLLKTKNTEQLLSNLLYWTMSQMNGVKVNMVTLNLKEAVAPVLQVVENSANEKGIDIDDAIPVGIYLIADRDMLQLMVRNLVNNAIKFTFPGGKIRINCMVENSECKVMISDNGMGIPPDKQSSIFSLKTDSTYGTKQEKGTGLGLVLCKDFAEQQNGTIGFESETGKGTTFYFGLKVAKPIEDEIEVPLA